MDIWKQLLTAHTALSAAFFSLHTANGKGARNKFGICFQLRNEQLKPRMTIWTLRNIGNDAMNAPRYWQRCNECSAMLATAQWCLTIKVQYNILITFPASLIFFLLSVLHVYCEGLEDWFCLSIYRPFSDVDNTAIKFHDYNCFQIANQKTSSRSKL